MTHIKLTRAVESNYERDLYQSPTEVFQFELPSDATAHIPFQNVHEMRKAYKAEEAKLPLVSGKVMFEYDQDPNVKNCNKIKVRCLFCRARVYYKLEGGVFLVTLFNNHHTHYIKRFADKIYESLFRYERDKNRMRWIRRKMKQEINMGNPEKRVRLYQDPHRLLMVEKYNTFSQLKVELDRQGYEYLTDTQAETEEDRYPRLIVMVSKLMRDSFKKYGDLLSFDITYNLLRNFTSDGKQYRLGVFCVTDTNIRILIAGIALMSQEGARDFANMFEMFFRLHSQSPQPYTIITDQQKTMEQGIEMLRRDGRYTGIHIFDPFHMVNNMRENLKGEEDKVRASVKLVSEIIRCRSLKEHTQLLFEIGKDVENSQLYDQFRDRAEKICYWEIPRSFIGINRFSCEKINDLIKIEVPYYTTINALVEEVMRIDQKMHQKSVEGYRIYRYPIYLLLDDERLKMVRYHYEVKAFERFIENYLKGLYEVYPNKDLPSKTPESQPYGDNYTVRVVDTGEIFAVRNWKCYCEELDKTGVPCVHLIACARSDPNKYYYTLFRRRWWKDVPILSSDVIVWAKRNRPKPAHRYKCKPTLKEYAMKYLRYIQHATSIEPVVEEASVDESDEQN